MHVATGLAIVRTIVSTSVSLTAEDLSPAERPVSWRVVLGLLGVEVLPEGPAQPVHLYLLDDPLQELLPPLL